MAEGSWSAPHPGDVGTECLTSGKALSLLPIIAGLALLIGLLGTSMLVSKRLSGVQLPGCGSDDVCAGAEASRWSQVGGWPIAYLGLAYFAALAIAGRVWSMQNDRLILYVLRAGMLVSCGLVAAMIHEGLFCVYCLVTHLANGALWLSMECRSRSAAISWRRAAVAVGAFLLVSSGLGVGEHRHREATAALAQKLRQETLDALPGPQSPVAAQASRLVFYEPYRLGPAKPAVGVVLFADMQCEHCRQALAEGRRLVDAYPGRVSFSVKHFPLCRACNMLVRGIHRNSCQCARAAEAAGILQGAEGFWRLIDWLSLQQGVFTQEELRDALPGLGFSDPSRFLDAMNGKETLLRVLDDISEGAIFHSEKLPLLIVNGVEFKGWMPGQDALAGVVEAALAKTSETARH